MQHGPGTTTPTPSEGRPLVVLGSLNMDLVIRTPHLPRPGETVLGGGFATSQGGKGANQAIAAARAGGRVAMIGAIGTDAFGDDHAATLAVNGVETALLRRLGWPLPLPLPPGGLCGPNWCCWGVWAAAPPGRAGSR